MGRGAHSSAASANHAAEWVSLGTPSSELRLEFTLPTGQSFRWQRTADNEYTGVVCNRVVQLRQESGDVLCRVLARAPGVSEAEDLAVLHDYLNLGTSLSQLAEQWSSKDKRFRSISPYFPGARMLRQDPLECLFQFICSSNNHISRIHGMVQRLCSSYGTPLPIPPAVPSTALLPAPPSTPAPPTPALVALSPLDPPTTSKFTSLPSHSGAPPPAEMQSTTRPPAIAPPSACTSPSPDAAASQLPLPLPPLQHQPTPQQQQQQQRQQEIVGEMGCSSMQTDGAICSPSPDVDAAVCYYAFPTLQQLALATEEQLRGSGFGYRAKFIVGSVRCLLEKPEGGEQWLMNLRKVPTEEAIEALCTLPGIGPKVAACVALFSLDKHDAIPVDTHVWQIAVRYYTPHLAGKSLTKQIHTAVAQAFVDRFGPYAGWAHNTLFISELASMRELLPPSLQPKSKGKTSPKTVSAKKPVTPSRRVQPSDSSASGELPDLEQESTALHTPDKPKHRARATKRASTGSSVCAAQSGGEKVVGVRASKRKKNVLNLASAQASEGDEGGAGSKAEDKQLVQRQSSRRRQHSRKLEFDRGELEGSD